MVWLKGKRISITKGHTSDSVMKGVVAELDQIGIRLERDQGSDVSLTWRFLDDYIIISIDEPEMQKRISNKE